MFTLINSSLQSIPNNPITKGLSEINQKYIKIAVIVGVIFSTLTSLYFIYRSYKGKQLSVDNSPIPPHVTPKDPIKSPKDLSQKDDQTKKDIKNDDQGKLNSPKKSPAKDSPAKDSPDLQKTAQELADEELAKKLQQQFDQDELQVDLLNDMELLRLMQEKDAISAKPLVNPKTPVDVVDAPVVDVDNPVIVESPKKEKPPTPPSPFLKVEKMFAEISEKAFTNTSFSTVKAISSLDAGIKNQIPKLLDELIGEFEKRNPFLKKIKNGDPVPAYFASGGDHHLENEKKYYSLIGIRNLLQHGPRIFDDFRKQQFIGGEHHYAYDTGLKTFKYYTGNTVDLDTELKATNDADALKEAEKKIIEFGENFGLKNPKGGKLTAYEVARQLPNRKLDLPANSAWIHNVGADHLDRSNHGIWKRLPVGKTFYYVNTPNKDVVLFATLQIPYLLAELLYRVKQQNNDKLPKDFLDDFFDNGLSTKCYNDKSAVFLNFYHNWSTKLNGDVIDPSVDALRKLAKGEFGEAMRKKDPNVVLKQAFTREKLIAFLENNPDFESLGLTLEQYKAIKQPKIIAELKSRGVWEAALYHTEDSDDYFLLNQKSLDLFIKDFHGYMYF